MMPLKSRNRGIIFLLFGVLALAASFWGASEAEKLPEPKKQEDKMPQEKASDEASKLKSTIVENISLQALKKFLAKESVAISQLDQNPSVSMARIQARASQLSDVEVSYLAQNALEESVEGDQRFLAVFLLSEAKSESALKALTKIALAPLSNGRSGRFRSLDQSIRAMAIESMARFVGNLAAKNTLLAVVEKQSDRFLVDRAQRALYGWRMQDPYAVAKQDIDALKELLHK